MAGFHPLRDVSGPTSSITGDPSDSFKLCHAHRAGECYAGSVAGQIYANVPNLDTTEDGCKDGEFYGGWHDVCVGNYPSIANAITQWTLPGSSRQKLANGAGSRVLGRLWHDYRNLPVTSNAKATPDGSWFLGRTEFAGKLPAFPAADTVSRSTWVTVSLSLKPPAGLGADNVIVEFGYDPSYRCTSRAEVCVKDANPSEPYVFAGDAIAGIPCAAGCTVNIPAVSQKVLYYVWKLRNASGDVVGRGAPASVVIP